MQPMQVQWARPMHIIEVVGMGNAGNRSSGNGQWRLTWKMEEWKDKLYSLTYGRKEK